MKATFLESILEANDQDLEGGLATLNLFFHASWPFVWATLIPLHCIPVRISSAITQVTYLASP